jgi:hypothetical protein
VEWSGLQCMVVVAASTFFIRSNSHSKLELRVRVSSWIYGVVPINSRPTLHRLWGLMNSSCRVFAARVVCQCLCV